MDNKLFDLEIERAMNKVIEKYGIQNRNDSYKQLKDENLNTQELLVAGAIREGYTNARDISEYIDIEVQTVRARLTELCQKNILKETGKVYYQETNRKITVYSFKENLFN